MVICGSITFLFTFFSILCHFMHVIDSCKRRRCWSLMTFRKQVISILASGLFALCASLCLGQDQAPAPEQTGQLVPKGPLGVSSTWVVVNLFSGPTSKQAVIVRDKLIRAGAEGHGIIIPYKEATVENIARIRPAFIALSPNGVPWCKYRGKSGTDLQNFFRSLKVIIDEFQVPVLGICGGHQALALAFGGKVGPIRGGEDDCFPYGHNPTERGRRNVYVLQDDPLFRSMGKSLNLVQNHYDEVKRLPEGFIALAENNLCRYQIIRHPTRPAYGVQAHTEYWLPSKPDGGSLLRNFLAIAREHNQLVRQQSVQEPKKTTREKQG
jgi:GMP synthase (glutamine-hydrolysing)